MGWGSIGIQLLMVILAQVLFGVLSGIGYPLRFDLYDSAYLSPTMYYLLNCVVYIIAVVLPFLLCLTLMKLPVNDTFRFEKVGIGTAVLCVLFGVGFCMFSNIPTNIVVTFLDEMGYNTTFPESPEADTILASILNVISISIYRHWWKSSPSGVSFFLSCANTATALQSWVRHCCSECST